MFKEDFDVGVGVDNSFWWNDDGVSLLCVFVGCYVELDEW